MRILYKYNTNILSYSSIYMPNYGIIKFFITDKGSVIFYYIDDNKKVKLYTYTDDIDSLFFLLEKVGFNINILNKNKKYIDYKKLDDFEKDKQKLPEEIIKLLNCNLIIDNNLTCILKIIKCYRCNYYYKKSYFNSSIDDIDIICNFTKRNIFGCNKEYYILNNGIICNIKYIKNGVYIKDNKYKIYGKLLNRYISSDKIRHFYSHVLDSHIIKILKNIDHKFFDIKELNTLCMMN